MTVHAHTLQQRVQVSCPSALSSPSLRHRLGIASNRGLIRGGSGFTEEFVAHCNSSIQANPPRSCVRSTSATTMVEVNDTDVPFATTRSGGMTLR
jgi:hypothetical protein